MLFIKIKKSKVPAYKELLAEYQLKDEEVAYIGDDLFDLAVMKRVGFPATVADATEEAKSVSILISDFGMVKRRSSSNYRIYFESTRKMASCY